MTSVQNIPAKFKSKEFTERLTASARKAQSAMPTADELKTTDKATKALFERLSTFLQDVASTTDWTDANLTGLAKDASWAQTSIGLRLRPADTPGGGPTGTVGQTPSSACQDLYEKCMQEESCTHSIVCLCCLPCVVDYAGCMRKIIFKPGGGGGTTVVTTGGGTYTHNPN
jgi:hypothetical protein